jgi:hypothetical protein
MQDANSYPTERPMPKCTFCDNELTPDTKPEHVLLSALGGRMAVIWSEVFARTGAHAANVPYEDKLTAARLKKLLGLRDNKPDEDGS